MTTGQRGLGLAAAALLLVVTAACSDAPGSASPSPSPASPTASTSTASPSPSETTQPTKFQRAAASATQMLRKYYRVLDGVRQDPDRPLSDLAAVATSTELSSYHAFLKRERKKGLRQIGDTRIAELTVQSVNLDNSDPAGGLVPTVQIDVCVDVSHADLVDRNGESVVADSRPDTSWVRYFVSNYRWDEKPKTAWRVATSRTLEERTPCAATS